MHRNKRRKFNFKGRGGKDKHSYMFYGMPDEGDNFYAVKGEKSDLDHITISRKDIKSDSDIVKCVGGRR